MSTICACLLVNPARILSQQRHRHLNGDLGAYVQESGTFDSLVKNPLDWIFRSRKGETTRNEPQKALLKV